MLEDTNTLSYLMCVAIMIVGAALLTAAYVIDYRHPVAEYVRPQFPSWVELALGATVLLALAAVGYVTGGM
jgi:hypothetical protein